MIVKSTVLKVLVILIIFGIVAWLYGIYLIPKSQQVVPGSTSDISPKSQISLAPSDKKSGWTIDEENQILNMCPLPSFASGICKCALTKVEQQYSFSDAMKMYSEYQKTQTLNPQLQAIISECK